MDPDLLLLGFAGLMCVAAWRMLTGCPDLHQGRRAAIALDQPLTSSGPRSGSTTTTNRLRLRTVVAMLAAGTGVGFLTGLFGVGGGFVIVPALTLVLRLSMPEAIGTSLLVIAINSAVALSTRIATTGIDWSVALPFVVAAIGGVLVGGRVADRLDAERSLRWFAALLVGVAAYTAFEALRGLAG